MLLLLVLHLLWNALNNAPSNRAAFPLSFCLFYHWQWFFFDCFPFTFAVPLLLLPRCLFSILCIRRNTHSGFIFTFICMQGGWRGRRERARAGSSRVCKFFSKNSLRDNGFSMSHTSLPTSTSLPRHDNFSNIPSPLAPAPPLNSDNYLHSLPASPVALCFWGMIDGKSQ